MPRLPAHRGLRIRQAPAAGSEESPAQRRRPLTTHSALAGEGGGGREGPAGAGEGLRAREGARPPAGRGGLRRERRGNPAARYRPGARRGRGPLSSAKMPPAPRGRVQREVPARAHSRGGFRTPARSRARAGEGAGAVSGELEVGGDLGPAGGSRAASGEPPLRGRGESRAEAFNFFQSPVLRGLF